MTALPATVAISVFGLFHPVAVDIEPWGASRVEIRCVGAINHVLEGRQRARLTGQCVAAGPDVDFVLSVPGKIRRHYRGALRTGGTPFAAVVTMDLERAVASTVAAEAPAGAGSAMLEAQAIVTRSYFAAGRGRHRTFDFCDTTHCQFIKDPPANGSTPVRATTETTGKVLVYQGRVIAAFYAARCNGFLTPLPLNRIAANSYPYYAVRCEHCLRLPKWEPPKPNARPHYHGMCQFGAADLARQGWTAARILAQYYPGTELETVPH